MQQFFQAVTVDVPHAVEIAGGEPVGIEYLLGFGTTDGIQDEAFELIVRQTVLSTRTDVIVVLPELFRHVRTAYPLQQTSAVFDRSPLQYAADGHMEHDRVVVLENRRIEDTRLTQRCPGLDARVGDDTFRLRFGQTVVVVCRDADRVTCATPMKRFAAVAHLSYRTDIHHFGLLVSGLRQHGFGDILCCGDIGAQRRFRTIVRLRRHHTAYVQHDVCTGHTAQHIFVFGQVSPYDVQRFVLRQQRRQQFFVFLTRPRQNTQRVLFRIAQDLHHACVAHRTGCTGQEYGCFCHILFFIYYLLSINSSSVSSNA